MPAGAPPGLWGPHTLVLETPVIENWKLSREPMDTHTACPSLDPPPPCLRSPLERPHRRRQLCRCCLPAVSLPCLAHNGPVELSQDESGHRVHIRSCAIALLPAAGTALPRCGAGWSTGQSLVTASPRQGKALWVTMSFTGTQWARLAGTRVLPSTPSTSRTHTAAVRSALHAIRRCPRHDTLPQGA